ASKRQPEALLPLRDDLVGQESAQRLLEEMAKPLALELLARTQAQRVLDQCVSEHRERHFDACGLAHPRDLWQVAVRKRELEVPGKQAVDLRHRPRVAGV